MKTDEQVHIAARVLLPAAAAVTLCLFAVVLVLAAVPVLVAAAPAYLTLPLRRVPRLVPPRLALAAHC